MNKKELLEQLRIILKEVDQTAFIKPKQGTTKIVQNISDKELDSLKKDQNVDGIETLSGKKLKEQEGVNFSRTETLEIGKKVGKALALAIREQGDEIEAMKMSHIKENAFTVKAIFKNGNEETYDFYIEEDTLKLSGNSYDKEISDVGVKPSGEAIVNVELVKNEILKHFKSLYENKVREEYVRKAYFELVKEQDVKQYRKKITEGYQTIDRIIDAQEAGDRRLEKELRDQLKGSYWFPSEIEREIEKQRKERQEELQKRKADKEARRKMSKSEFEQILRGAVYDMGGDPSYSEIVDVVDNLLYNKKFKEKATNLFEKNRYGKWPTSSELSEFLADYMSSYVFTKDNIEEDIDTIEEAPEEPAEEEPAEEEAPEAGPETVLPDNMDILLNKFPTLKDVILDLHTRDYPEFVESIDWISPRPSAFRVNLTNGQYYILKWTGKQFEAQVQGKKYMLGSVADFQQALDKLSQLYKEAPYEKSEEELEEPGADFGGGSSGGGGGSFPGGEEGGFEGEELAGGEEETGEEEGGEDLGDEEISFEEPAEEPED